MSAPIRKTSIAKLQPSLAPVLYGYDGRALTPGDPFEGRSPGPGRPLPAALPPGSEPRAWLPWLGYNLTYVPRSEFGDRLTPFQILRQIPSLCSVVGACLNNVKMELLGFSWDVKAKEGTSQEQTSAISAAKEWLRRPDGEDDFTTWLSAAIDEVLTTDALAMYRHRTKAGDPLALRLIDGASIKPLTDYLGETPAPPAAAYQQIYMGRVESEFTRSWHNVDARQPDGEEKHELIYAPFWPNTYLPYGMGPIERGLMTINLIMRRDGHMLAFYTDGSISDMFWKCPPTWTPEQIQNAQDILDQLLGGNIALRSKLRLMGGGEGTGLENPRSKESYSPEYDEWLAGLIAYHFGTSSQPLRKQMNRATAVQADAAETDSGTKPMKKRLASLLTTEFEEFFGWKDIEFLFTDEKATDEKLKLDKNVAYLGKVMTRDEVRKAEGLPDLTPEQEAELEGDPEIDEAPPPPGSPGAAGVAKPKPGSPLPGQKDGVVEEQVRAAAADLKRWRKVALKDVAAGRVRRRFETTAIPVGLRTALTEWLDHACSAEDVLWGFRALTRSRRPILTARKRIRLERKLRRVVKDHLNARAGKVARLAVEALQGGRVERSEKPSDQQLNDAFDWRVLAKELRAPLEDAYQEGGMLAEDAGGLEEAFGITDEDARAYAEQRAAELVGMKRHADGSLHDNPNARWSVAQTVRDEVRTKVSTAIKEGWSDKRLADELEGPSMWEARAEMVARTETAIAVNRGALATYDGANVESVTVLDGPGCLEDGHDDSEAGVNGEIWSLERAAEFPVGHPHCRRDFAPVISTAEEAA